MELLNQQRGLVLLCKIGDKSHKIPFLICSISRHIILGVSAIQTIGTKLCFNQKLKDLPEELFSDSKLVNEVSVEEANIEPDQIEDLIKSPIYDPMIDLSHLKQKSIDRTMTLDTLISKSWMSIPNSGGIKLRFRKLKGDEIKDTNTEHKLKVSSVNTILPIATIQACLMVVSDRYLKQFQELKQLFLNVHI